MRQFLSREDETDDRRRTGNRMFPGQPGSNGASILPTIENEDFLRFELNLFMSSNSTCSFFIGEMKL